MYCKGASLTHGGVCKNLVKNHESCTGNIECMSGDCQYTKYYSARKCKPGAGFDTGEPCWAEFPPYGTLSFTMLEAV